MRLLEDTVKTLWSALKTAETEMKESVRLLFNDPSEENIAIVQIAQEELVRDLKGQRATLRAKLKRFEAENVLSGESRSGHRS